MSDTWPRRYGQKEEKPRTRASQRNRLERGIPFFLTVHAIERFRARVCPSASFGRARHDLFRLAEGARKTDGQTFRGDAIWVATAEPKVQFVVRSDPKFALGTCTTVYPPETPVQDEEP